MTHPSSLPSHPSSFRPYPSYKASGVAWLGEVPEHWEVRRLKTVAEVNLSNVDKKSAEGQEPVSLCNYTDVYYNEHITNQIDFMRATATPEQIKRFSLKEGDVLVTKDSESWDDIAVPAVVREDLDNVLCGYHLAMIRPAEQTDGRFLARAFSAVGPKDQFQIKANGITRFGLGGDAIRTGLFPFPPLPEQRAIAAFLDHKTAEIDALIAAKERLIALLREKRAALITQAVTKGLDPDVPMKDSGIEWLGEVPEGWEVRSLRRILTRRRIKNGSAERPMLSLSAYRGIVFKEYDDEALVRPTEENSDYVVVKPGQLVVNPMWVINSSIGVSSISGIVSPAYRVYDVSSDLFGLFLHNLTKSLPYISQYNRYIRGLTTYDRSVREDDFLNIEALIPPLPEQHAISAFLDRQTAEIDELVNKVQEAIDRLKEYRTALISAAVTGKIDVRDL